MNDYVIIDLNTKEVYNKRTGLFQSTLTKDCLYKSVRGRAGLVPSKHCNARHLQIWSNDHYEVRNPEIHIMRKVREDSAFDSAAGRPHVVIDAGVL